MPCLWSPQLSGLYEECVRGQTFGYLDLTGTQFLAPRYTAEAGSARAWRSLIPVPESEPEHTYILRPLEKPSSGVGTPHG